MNAKDEFLKHIGDRKVRCVCMSNGDNYYSDAKQFNLKIGYSKSDYENFIKSLNFIYDSGYGGQELYGYIWYVDGTWSSRGEYDGSEWWVYNKVPDIPEELQQ